MVVHISIPIGKKMFSKVRENNGRFLKEKILLLITESPKTLNSDIDEVSDTRIHVLTECHNKLFTVWVDAGVPHSYVGKKLLEKINNTKYKMFRPILQKLIVVNGEVL